MITIFTAMTSAFFALPQPKYWHLKSQDSVALHLFVKEKETVEATMAAIHKHGTVFALIFFILSDTA